MRASRIPLVFLALAACAAGHALEFEAPPEITWTLEPQTIETARGATITLRLYGEIPAGYHTYSLKDLGANQPTVIELEGKGPLHIQDPIRAPKPELVFSKGFQKDLEEYHGKITFEIDVLCTPDANPGAYGAHLVVKSQLCDAKGRCLPIDERKLPFVVTLTEEKVTPPPPSQPAVAEAPADLGGQESEIERAKKEGLGTYLWVALGGGFLSLLTPCVFPMIPITVSFFTKRKAATRTQSIRDAGLYALGIVITFSAIGMLFAGFLGAAGIRNFAQNGWVNLAIGLLFVVLALNLFGVFEIPLPTQWLSKVDSTARQNEGGIVSILLMAFVFSITSFTCTVPFVGTVLISVSQGEWFMPLLGMLMFSTAFASPFFLLALFPSMLKKLPKAGGWMNSVKVVMGFLELAAALKFFSTTDLAWNDGQAALLPRPFFISVWMAITLLTAGYLLGLFKFAHDSELGHVGGARILFATFFLSLTLYLYTGLHGNTFGKLEAFIPPPAGTQSSELTWIVDDFEAAQAKAREEQRPLFVDFSGFR